MRRALFILVSAVMLVPLFAAGGYFYFLHYMDGPGPLREPAVIVAPRGGTEAIGVTLAEAGVVDHTVLFIAAVKLTEIAGPLKAGEYAFPAAVSLTDVLKLLRDGKTVVHRLTVPEGITSHQVVALLNAEPALSGEIGETPPEGALLPETYHFSRGDSRAVLLDRMRKAMSKALAEAWAARAEGLPFDKPEQALALASIVEKETGVAAERAKVAGVFVNRLRQGMKLQSDPTTIYALTQGKADLGRPLTRADWRVESPYNTYFADGLPPTPIANPGRAALAAVLNPEKHNLLYFVADGSGGHAFAATLPEHNKNVQRWRDVQKAP